MRLSFLKLVVLFTPLILLPSESVANGENPWTLWLQPGVHAIMRHATAPGFGDPENFTLGQCNTQRNLNDQGRREARTLGDAIRKRGIKLTAVYSSQWCRCLHTAEELNVGKVQELPSLNSFFQEQGIRDTQIAALKKHVAALKADDKVLYVTHQVNTTGLTGVYPASGQIILFRMTASGEVEVLGKLNPDQVQK